VFLDVPAVFEFPPDIAAVSPGQFTEYRDIDLGKFRVDGCLDAFIADYPFGLYYVFSVHWLVVEWLGKRKKERSKASCRYRDY